MNSPILFIMVAIPEGTHVSGLSNYSTVLCILLQVYADEELSCLQLSPDETTLVYVAEKKQPKPTSFFASFKE